METVALIYPNPLFSDRLPFSAGNPNSELLPGFTFCVVEFNIIYIYSTDCKLATLLVLSLASLIEIVFLLFID